MRPKRSSRIAVIFHTALSLAPRAIDSSPTSHHNLLQPFPTVLADLPRPSVNLVLKLEKPPHPIRVHIVRNRRATQLNRMPQHRHQFPSQPQQLLPGKPRSLPPRTNPRPKQALICINISHSMQQRLVQQSRLDRHLPPPEQTHKRILANGQRLRPWPPISSRPHGQPPKPTSIHKPQLIPTAQRKYRMRVRRRRNIRRRNQQPPRHSQMNQKFRCPVITFVITPHCGSQPRSLHRSHNRLPHPPNPHNPSPRQHLRNLRLRTLECLRLSTRPDRFNPLPVHSFMHSIGNRLHFRQLWHLLSLP